MSDSRENLKAVDLSTLQMMPDWVTELGAEPAKEYQKFEAPEEGSGEKRERHGGRGRPGGFGRGEQRGPRPGGPGGDRGGRREGGGGREGGWRDREAGGGRRDGRGPRGEHRGDHRGAPVRLPMPEGLEVEVSATGPCLDALVGRIKMSGRAFGMFDLAKVVLGARDRIEVEFIRRAPETAPRLFRSGEGEELGVWMDRMEAARRFLRKDAIEKFYRVEETQVEPPKGDFKAVAVCGLSGQIIGPPNHHSYQTAVLRLHRERFAKMPLAQYRTKIRTETDEALVNRWKEEQSRQVRYIYPREPVEGGAEVVLDSWEAVERHFLTELCEDVVHEVDRAVVPGHIPGKQLSPDLLTLLRQEVEVLQRNPFSLVKRLCGQLERRGLKIFKRQGKKLFVSKARPRPLDPQVPLSEDVSLIIGEIRKHPGVRVSELVTFLAPSRPEQDNLKPGELSPRETAILTHLRWLIDEGFVIEYASTALFLGVQSAKQESGKGETGGESEEHEEGDDLSAGAQQETEGPELTAEADDSCAVGELPDEAEAAPGVAEELQSGECAGQTAGDAEVPAPDSIGAPESEPCAASRCGVDPCPNPDLVDSAADAGEPAEENRAAVEPDREAVQAAV